MYEPNSVYEWMENLLFAVLRLNLSNFTPSQTYLCFMTHEPWINDWENCTTWKIYIILHHFHHLHHHPPNNYVQWFYRNKFCMANKWDWIGSTCFQFRDHIMNTWNLFIWLLIMRNFLEFIPCVEQYIYKICTRMQFNRIVLVIINGWPRISIYNIHNSSK